MLVKALACDFGSTLGEGDRIGPRVRESLGRARHADVRLILVSGRTCFELMRMCDCLHLFSPFGDGARTTPRPRSPRPRGD
jgi:hydroxymethylpyrimidine pyrophosphatase-like HAD family hydrolase